MQNRITTKKKREIVDITGMINGWIRESEAKSGVCHIFVSHTTAALTTADLDPGTDQDMLDAFEAMVPAYAGENRPDDGRVKLEYRHPHDPSHVGDHIMSSLIGSSVVIPIENGELVLGKWQRVILVEFDGPRERNLIFRIIGDVEDAK